MRSGHQGRSACSTAPATGGLPRSRRYNRRAGHPKRSATPRTIRTAMSRSLIIGSVALLLLANAVERARADSSAAACWLGQVGSGAEERRAVLELELGQDGAWHGLFHRLGSEVNTDTLHVVAVAGPDVSFERPDDKGTLRFQGKLSENGDALTGEFTREQEKLPLTMQRISGPDAAGRALLGNWLGDLKRNGVPMLKLVLRFAEAPCGQVTAVM